MLRRGSPIFWKFLGQADADLDRRQVGSPDAVPFSTPVVPGPAASACTDIAIVPGVTGHDR